MVTAVTIRANTTSNTGAGQDYATVPGNYVDLDLNNDYLLFATETTAVIDGADEPTDDELNEAATLITGAEVEAEKCFLWDDSGNQLREIDGAGSTDDRYVFVASFDGATASEPTLEAWDDNTHSTANKNVLGAGTPANSMVKVIRTTDGTPGAAWVGTRIAGGTKLNMNGGGGALGAAADLYWNMHIDVPASYSTPFTEEFVITVRYTFN
jgi:hypothetical protein